MPRYDHADVKARARRRWAEILSQVAGIPPAALDGDHHPCPKCGGADRFRFTDRDGDGSLICNNCARRDCGDGLAAVQWATGMEFPEALARVAEFVGAPEAAGGGAPGRNGKPGSGHRSANSSQHNAADPGKDLEPMPWSQLLAAMFCRRKAPIQPAAILAAGGRLARYRRQFTVVDLPVLDADGAVVGHVLYNASGGTLPKYDRTGKIAGQLKVKNTAGTAPGLIGRLPAASEAPTNSATRIMVKVEGPSDALALLSCPDLPADVAVVTNAMGAGERPAPWMIELAAGRQVLVVGDADRPGEQGAAVWAAAFAGHAEESRQVKLPFEVTETHGKDLRDWLAEGHGWADLLELASQAVKVAAGTEPPVPEAVDDPHRLARLNLERYASSHAGRTLRFWRDEWYVWKRNRYRKIGENEFRAKLAASIKTEFDRAFRAGETDEVRKVTGGLVSNVMLATSGYVTLSAEVEFGTWLEDRSRRAYVSMANGILDIDAVLAGKPENECLLEHSPQWFSLVSVPYAFDSDAGFEPTRWLNYLNRVLESDAERISILQEWAGYLLLPETGQQKFLVCEGDGANGKSVYSAAMTALLGGENVSNIQLEVFGDRFSRTETLGKLANICGDVGEIDKMSEGYVKSFTSGDRMYFDRKGVSGLNVVPTARLMLACNHRPRFSDRSDGVWRRMILMPFRVQIQDSERVMGMDKSEWWEASGELPAIFNWALLGLARLRAQGKFTRSQIVDDARESYREEMNPARMFLKEFVEQSNSGAIRSRLLYRCYCEWVKENGYRPLSEKSFGKEVHRMFSTELKKRGERAARFFQYERIQFSTDEICGTKVDQFLLDGF